MESSWMGVIAGMDITESIAAVVEELNNRVYSKVAAPHTPGTLLCPFLFFHPPTRCLALGRPVCNQTMCVSAIVAEKNSPSNAVFVDYSNLPDAITEFVFPQHFGMEAEVSKVTYALGRREDEGSRARFFLVLSCLFWSCLVLSCLCCNAVYVGFVAGKQCRRRRNFREGCLLSGGPCPGVCAMWEGCCCRKGYCDCGGSSIHAPAPVS